MSKKYSILIVDDDKFLLDMYRKKFERDGATADVAVGSDEALNKLRGGAKPDVLVLDIIMPSMDGIELLEAIRKEKLAPDATVVMLTNESNRERIDKAKTLGIKGYIVKATSIPSEVIEKIKEIANLK
ncbi:MAG: response regulator [Patescibacteria group bacterium]